jgi:hypothetical protein
MIMMKKIVCEIEVFLLCAGSECEGFRESGVKKNSREIFFLFIFQFLGIAFHWSLFKFSMEQRKLVVSYIYINYIFLLIELIKNSRYWTSCFNCLILKKYRFNLLCSWNLNLRFWVFHGMLILMAWKNIWANLVS